MNAPPQASRAPWSVVWVAFAVRVLYLTLAHTYRIRAYDDHMLFGEEMGRIARALATGYGFSDPFRGHTGPTAWVGPLFPLLLAGVFKLFGVFTPLSAWVILTLDSLFSALTAGAIWEIAARCFNQNVARWSAWIWALYPAAMQYAVRWVWDTSLTTFLFSWVLVVACARLRSGATLGRWALLGLLWGLTGLSNPALFIFLPACGLWVLAGTPGWKRQAGGVLLAAAALHCLPGTLDLEELASLPPIRAHTGQFRRRAVPGQWTRSNRPNHGARPSHPGARPTAPVHQLGRNLRYSRMRGEQAMAFIHSDPDAICGQHPQASLFFWAGVPHPEQNRVGGIRPKSEFHLWQCLWPAWDSPSPSTAKVPAAGLFAWAFLLLPLVYYAVAAHARFRHPLEPLMVVLGVYLFQSAELTKTGRKRKLRKLGI
jgi:hypothetical protein